MVAIRLGEKKNGTAALARVIPPNITKIRSNRKYEFIRNFRA